MDIKAEIKTLLKINMDNANLLQVSKDSKLSNKKDNINYINFYI